MMMAQRLLASRKHKLIWRFRYLYITLNHAGLASVSQVNYEPIRCIQEVSTAYSIMTVPHYPVSKPIP